MRDLMKQIVLSEPFLTKYNPVDASGTAAR
jgi:hypothetical protein